MPTANLLLAMLPPEDRLHLLAHCEPIELIFDDVLCEPGKRSHYAYFPRAGFISMLPAIERQASLDVGLVGSEGMLGICLALGAPVPPVQGLVRRSGSAWRIKAVPFRRELERSPPLRRVVNRYICVLASQLALTAACIHFHLLEERLALWLLMAADRAHSDEFQMTHELLARLLGVRRVGVTAAANSLRKHRLIRYERGHIKILDRRGLERASCACYVAAQHTYDHMLK